MRPHEYEKMAQAEERHWWFLAKRRLAQTFLQDLQDLPAGRTLDLGCGTGGLSRSLGDPVATDLYLPALRTARGKGLTRVLVSEAGELPFADGAFDLVTAFDVLYHAWVADDLAVLHEIHRVLAPGGHLLLTDSAMPSLRSSHDEAVMGARRYTVGEMRAKLQRSGFTVLRATYAHFLLFPAIAAGRLLSRAVGGNGAQSDVAEMPPLLNRMLTELYRVEVALLRRMDLPWGSSVLCLARKARSGSG